MSKNKIDNIIVRVEGQLKKDMRDEAEMFGMNLSQYARHLFENRFDILPEDGE